MKEESSIMSGKGKTVGDRETCAVCYRLFRAVEKCFNHRDKEHRLRRSLARTCAKALKKMRGDNAEAVERRILN